MHRALIYLNGYAATYLEAYREARGGGRATDALTEVVRLAIGGPQSLGRERAAVAMADAEGAAAAHRLPRRYEPNKAEAWQVRVVGVGVVASLRRSAAAAGEALSPHVASLIRRRIWGHLEAPERPWRWDGITTWVRSGRTRTLHVLQGGANLTTRVLSEMDQARALTSPDYLPRLVRVVAEEGALELQNQTSDLLAVLVVEDGYEVTIPLGGIFGPLLDHWESEDGDPVSAWSLCYEGSRVEEAVRLSRWREGKKGREWAVKRAREVNAAWCRAHNVAALMADGVRLDVRPILEAHPLESLEEE
jgi:hypothetical protein